MKKISLRIKRLDVKLSDKLKLAADRLARDQGCHTTSEYVRLLIRNDAERRGLVIPEVHPVRKKA